MELLKIWVFQELIVPILQFLESAVHLIAHLSDMVDFPRDLLDLFRSLSLQKLVLQFGDAFLRTYGIHVHRIQSLCYGLLQFDGDMAVLGAAQQILVQLVHNILDLVSHSGSVSALDTLLPGLLPLFQQLSLGLHGLLAVSLQSFLALLLCSLVSLLLLSG